GGPGRRYAITQLLRRRYRKARRFRHRARSSNRKLYSRAVRLRGAGVWSGAGANSMCTRCWRRGLGIGLMRVRTVCAYCVDEVSDAHDVHEQESELRPADAAEKLVELGGDVNRAAHGAQPF